MQKLGIIGASDLGNLIAHHILCTHAFQLIGFYDNYRNFAETGEYLGNTDQIVTDFQSGKIDSLLIGIGYTNFHFREYFFNYFSGYGIPFASFIHPSNYIDPSVTIGRGTVILPGCVVDRNVIFEENVFVNISCTIAHDTVIKKHSFISPAVNIAGSAVIGDKNFIGIGTTIINKIHTVAESVIGAGSVVIKNIPVKGTYAGNPCRKIN
jgi:sugar O-acyltransferase (sialic acid O-acetyltransferase NeuD family)